MTEHDEPLEGTGAEPVPFAALLASAELWDDPDPELEEAVVAAIAAEAGSTAVARRPVRATRPSRASRWSPIGWIAAAAAMVLIVTLGVLLVTGDDTDDPETATGALVELESTDLAPGATGDIVVETTPAGLKMVLNVDGLPPAADHSYYEAWIGSGTDRVSAGSFHLRGGNAPIALWAGIDDPAYRNFAITVQQVGGGAESSGQVVLRGTLPD
jgi:hypothetical protein